MPRWLWNGCVREKVWMHFDFQFEYQKGNITQSSFPKLPPDVAKNIFILFHLVASISPFFLPTSAFRCRRWTPAASRPSSPAAAAPPGRRRWPRSRWWPEEERATRPPAAGWAAPRTRPGGSWSYWSPKRFVWRGRRSIKTLYNQTSVLATRDRKWPRLFSLKDVFSIKILQTITNLKGSHSFVHVLYLTSVPFSSYLENALTKFRRIGRKGPTDQMLLVKGQRSKSLWTRFSQFPIFSGQSRRNFFKFELKDELVWM